MIIILGVIIWIILRGVSENGQEVFTDENIDLKISQVKRINDNTLDLTLKRGIGEGEFVGEPLAKPYGHRVYENGGVLTIETTWLQPGVTYILEAADSETGPFTIVQSGISVSSYQIKNITVSSPLRNVYRLREI